MSATYTPGEVSTMLSIPPSTLRRYVATFGEYLTPEARKKRGRNFTEEDINVIAQIRDLASQGIPLESIGPQIAQTFEHIPDSQEIPSTTALALFNSLSDQMSGISQELDQILEEQQRLKDRIEQLEEEARPWYKRIFKRSD